MRISKAGFLVDLMRHLAVWIFAKVEVAARDETLCSSLNTVPSSAEGLKEVLVSHRKYLCDGPSKRVPIVVPMEEVTILAQVQRFFFVVGGVHVVVPFSRLWRTWTKLVHQKKHTQHEAQGIVPDLLAAET